MLYLYMHPDFVRDRSIQYRLTISDLCYIQLQVAEYCIGQDPRGTRTQSALACVSGVAARFPTFEKYTHEWLNALEIED